MEWLSDPDAWIALLTLTTLEIVLGVDNLVFISILTSRLPLRQQPLARRLGLGFAMATRIGLLFTLTWIIGLTAPWFTIFGQEISGRDIILMLGGLFLLGKSVTELNARLEDHAHAPAEGATRARPAVHAAFAGVIVQIALPDMVFSLDSVITAVGLANNPAVMVIAIMIAVGVMCSPSAPSAGSSRAIPRSRSWSCGSSCSSACHWSRRRWSSAFPRATPNFPMGFAIFVEALNLRVRARARSPGGGE